MCVLILQSNVSICLLFHLSYNYYRLQQLIEKNNNNGLLIIIMFASFMFGVCGLFHFLCNFNYKFLLLLNINNLMMYFNSVFIFLWLVFNTLSLIIIKKLWKHEKCVSFSILDKCFFYYYYYYYICQQKIFKDMLS